MRSKILIVLFIFLTAVGDSLWAAGNTKSNISIKYKDGILDADIKEASIGRVFEELQKVNNMNYEIEKEVMEKKVTITLRNKELTQGIKEIINTVGNISYLFKYIKDKTDKYQLAGVYLRAMKWEESDKNILAEKDKEELSPEEIEIAYLANGYERRNSSIESKDGTWIDNSTMEKQYKYKIKAKNVPAGDLIEKLIKIAGDDEKIISDIEKIDKIIDIEAEGKYIYSVIKHDILENMKLKNYKVTSFPPELDEEMNVVKRGYYVITRIPKK